MPIKKFTEFSTASGYTPLSVGPDGESDLMPEMSAGYVVMESDGEVKPHIHDRVEIYLFLSGRAMVMTGDDIMEVSTGDMAIAPIGTPHAIKVIGDEPLRFYAFNSPPASTCPMEDAPEEYLWKWKRI